MKIKTSERIALQTHGLVPVGMPVGLNGDVAALRREFFAAKLHLRLVGADGEPVKPLSISVETMRDMLATHNATADASMSALAAGVQASIDTPVEPEAPAVVAPVEPEPDPVAAAPAVETPAPAVEELPPLADDAYAAAKPVAPARPSLSDVRARLAARARASQCTIVSLPVAPVSRPAPAPMPERLPGVGEFYCSACDHKHVVAAKDAWVHHPAWIETHFQGRAPTFEELSTVAVCGRVASKRNQELNWYPMPDVHEWIQSFVAQKTTSEAPRPEARAKKHSGGKATKTHAAPSHARSEVKLVAKASAGDSSGFRNEVFGVLKDWKPPTVK